ncbi:MAG: copper amine oxidase N-terminal domain-containing protein [Eubacteriales bacterium]|nr:copper amine oxidase N-terminal domain-containing protein [Eubacteriales bacterium]
MKRLKLTFVIFLLIILSALPVYSADASIAVSINGQNVDFGDIKPFIDNNNRTMVPLRPIAEAMGLVPEWNSDEKTAYFKEMKEYDEKPEGAYTDYTYISFKIGENMYYSGYHQDPNGETLAVVGRADGHNMDTAAIIKDGYTYAPIKYLAEWQGYSAKWDSNTKTVTLTPRDPFDFSE